MCANCLSQAEATLSAVAIGAYAVASALQLADPIKHDAFTVRFLESLDLDPVAILGADAVEQAQRWVPTPGRPATWRLYWTRGSRRPIASHSLAIAR